jgi:hypothetical protein
MAVTGVFTMVPSFPPLWVFELLLEKAETFFVPAFSNLYPQYDLHSRKKQPNTSRKIDPSARSTRSLTLQISLTASLMR